MRFFNARQSRGKPNQSDVVPNAFSRTHAENPERHSALMKSHLGIVLLAGFELISSNAQALELELVTRDSPQVRAFLASPTTKIFADDGLPWESYQEYLVHAESIPNGCRYTYSNVAEISGKTVVDQASDGINCIVLIRAGKLKN
jgi:hypothetical protein